LWAKIPGNFTGEVMTISERIFMLMDEQKMTKAEFSRQTGIAATTIQDWQKKGNEPIVR